MATMLLQLSMCFVIVIQLTSSQSTYDIIQQNNDVHRCGQTEEVLRQLVDVNSQLVTAVSQLQKVNSQLMNAVSQLQEDVSELKPPCGQKGWNCNSNCCF